MLFEHGVVVWSSTRYSMLSPRESFRVLEPDLVERREIELTIPKIGMRQCKL